LDAVDADALRAHLVQCPECATLARSERALDARLGQAMRQVPVPDGLRARILARLAEDRPVERPRWWKQPFGLGAAAAAVLAAVLAAYAFFPRQRPALELTVVFNQLNLTRPGAEAVSEDLKQLGISVQAPDWFNYHFHTGDGVAILPGYPEKRVPVIDFENKQARSRARVYIVSDRQFDLRSLADDPALADPSYTNRLTVRFPEARLEYRPGDHEAYLISYTGDNVNWLVQSSGNES
jgi:hypothetical protein